jgi:hypothetical protein
MIDRNQVAVGLHNIIKLTVGNLGGSDKDGHVGYLLVEVEAKPRREDFPMQFIDCSTNFQVDESAWRPLPAAWAGIESGNCE